MPYQQGGVWPDPSCWAAWNLPACRHLAGRPELHVGDGSHVVGSQVTHRKAELPQTSGEILPDTELEETAAHLRLYRLQDGFGGLAVSVSDWESMQRFDSIKEIGLNTDPIGNVEVARALSNAWACWVLICGL